MSALEILGYGTLVLLLVGFAFKTIIVLRAFSIAASLAILLFGLFAANYVVAAIGALMALVNLYRLNEMRRLVSGVRSAGGATLTVDWLLPFMSPLEMPAGHVLFSKGDKADAMFFVASGRVRIEGTGAEMTKGSFFGEIGVFSSDYRRTSGAKCVEACSLLRIDAARVRELCHQNPQFGFQLVGLLTERLMQNAGEPKRNPARSIV